MAPEPFVSRGPFPNRVRLAQRQAAPGPQPRTRSQVKRHFFNIVFAALFRARLQARLAASTETVRSRIPTPHLWLRTPPPGTGAGRDLNTASKPARYIGSGLKNVSKT